jgi:hypothetical protein
VWLGSSSLKNKLPAKWLPHIDIFWNK